MADADLLFESALELAAGVRRGDFSARELTELAFARIGELEPTIGAFTMTDAERALAAADAVEPDDPRPFAGVPTAIKDIGPLLAGYPYTCGSEIFGDFVAPFDSNVTRRIKDGGFVIVGKTSLPECGILCVTEPARYGATRNPFDPERTPGGSSGGAAAAVASGMLPLAHASDGAGSIRIPAACCGLVGLKPSRNRISHGPALAESLTSTDGFLTRTVDDAAATLDLLAGYEPGDANWAPPPPAPFLELARERPGRLKIGFTVKPSFDVPVDPLHLEAVATTVKLLEGLGHDVEEVELEPRPELLEQFMDYWAIGIASLVRSGAALSGREITEDAVEALTWQFGQRAAKISALDEARTENSLKSYARDLVTSLAPYDALLTPTLNLRPVEIGWIDSSHGMPAFDRAVQFTSFTAWVNLAGLPAISLPTDLIESDGLPNSVQLIGRPAGEGELLALARQVEEARPFAGLRPQI